MRTCFGLLCLIIACIPLTRSQTSFPVQRPKEPDWPSHYQGMPLRRLKLTAQEQRFLYRFPGHMAKFTDEERELHFRLIYKPTRMLHPISDCLRGAGYQIGSRYLEQDAWENTWGCVQASMNGQKYKVCERIYEQDGKSWSDVSAWFWANFWNEKPALVWWSVAVVETCGKQSCR